MTRGGIIRLIKYILNSAGLYMMTIIALLISTLVYRYPDCEVVRIKISENIGELILIYIPYLGLITGMNLLIERKIEKRQKSKEYLFMLYINLLFLLIAITYTSHHVYSNCIK